MSLLTPMRRLDLFQFDATSHRERCSVLSCIRRQETSSRVLLHGKSSQPRTLSSQTNGLVHVEYRILKHVVSSAAEAETTGIYANCCTTINLCNMIKALGRPQDPTEIETDNSTEVAFSNNELKAKRSKA